MRICTYCKILLPSACFRKRGDGSGKLRSRCIKCSNELFHAYELKNKDKKALRYQRDKKLHPERLKASAKKWRDGNKQHISEWHKKYYCEHKDVYLDKQHRRFNTEAGKKWRSEYHRKCTLENVNYRVSRNLRSRIWGALKTGGKSGSSSTLLGCSIEFLKRHLALQFTAGMSWDNYGMWHIDHIKPCISFDLTKESEQKICFNYENLQPLWADENIRKGGK